MSEWLQILFDRFTSWRVGLGSNRRANHVTLTTNTAVAHPQYSENNNIRVNDIGIIILSQPVELSRNIFPVLLPSVSSSIVHPILNVQGMVLGFAGSTSTGNEGLESLQAAYVRTMTYADCVGFYSAADESSHYCANDTELQSNFCLGDQVITL